MAHRATRLKLETFLTDFDQLCEVKPWVWHRMRALAAQARRQGQMVVIDLRGVTHLHYATSSFFITVFNPLTVIAFGAAFAGRGFHAADAIGLAPAPFGPLPPF